MATVGAQRQGAVDERGVGEERPCVVVGARLFPSGLWWSGIRGSQKKAHVSILQPL